MLWKYPGQVRVKYAYRTKAASFVDIFPAFWVSVTALQIRLTDPKAHNEVKTLHCGLLPYLDLTYYLNLKILSMD